jgi:hypothetical protein
MNRLINKKMDQSEALASTIVELNDKELEMVVGSGGGFPCPAHRDDDCDRDRHYDHDRGRCGCDDFGFSGHLRGGDLLSDLLDGLL